MNEVIEFQKLQIKALHDELKRVQNILAEMSEVSTKAAKNITVVTDEAFNQPISKLEKNYGSK